MKFAIQTIATIIVCFLLQTFLPWWTMAVGACAVGYIVGNKGYVSFLAGLIGVGILWLGMAYYIDHVTQSILTEKVSRLFPSIGIRGFAFSPPANIFFMTFLIGGLVGGFASLTGALLKSK
jgi:hypothetical protein